MRTGMGTKVSQILNPIIPLKTKEQIKEMKIKIKTEIKFKRTHCTRNSWIYWKKDAMFLFHIGKYSRQRGKSMIVEKNYGVILENSMILKLFHWS